MISKEKTVDILHKEYMKISTEFRMMHKSADDETKAMIEEGVKVWAEELADKIYKENFDAGILLTALTGEKIIPAIKALRLADGRLGLKEAKDICDGMRDGKVSEYLIPNSTLMLSFTAEEKEAGYGEASLSRIIVDLRAAGWSAKFIGD